MKKKTPATRIEKPIPRDQKYMAEPPRPPKKPTSERDMYMVFGGMIGLGAGYVLEAMTLGTPVGDMLIPLLGPAALGGAGGVMYVLGKGDMIKTMFMAKTFPGNYKYGLALATDGNGVTTVAALKKHNARDHYFIQKKSGKPIILDRNKAELGNPLITIDKIPFIQYSTSDSVPSTPDEEAAGVQFSEMARAMVEKDVPVYDEGGHQVMVTEYDASGRVVAQTPRTEKKMAPKYPEIYKIPLVNSRFISDMVYEAENREQLFAFAMNTVVMEKQYNVPDMQEMELVDEKTGNTLLDDKGAPITKLVERKDETGQTMFRRATPEEVEQLRFMKAEELCEEVIALRQECAHTEARSGISVLNKLYPFVVRPWMQGEMDNIRMQSKQQAIDEVAEAGKQAKRVDNMTVLMIGAGVAAFIVLIGAKAAGVW